MQFINMVSPNTANLNQSVQPADTKQRCHSFAHNSFKSFPNRVLTNPVGSTFVFHRSEAVKLVKQRAAQTR